jgi:hypothetical protein
MFNINTAGQPAHKNYQIGYFLSVIVLTISLILLMTIVAMPLLGYAVPAFLLSLGNGALSGAVSGAIGLVFTSIKK